MASMREEKQPITALKWAKTIPSDAATKREMWPPILMNKNNNNNEESKDEEDIRIEYDWSKPTNETYYDPDERNFATAFEEARRLLDYSYHRNPVLTRQVLQDSILSRIVEASSSSSSSSSSITSSSSSSSSSSSIQTPWIIFTAGPMGVGKGYVLSTLHSRQLFPLENFVQIDPDMIKTQIPEWVGYLQQSNHPQHAATYVHRESTQMSDILFEYSLLHGKNVLVDGSLRDSTWYRSLFRRIRMEYPMYRIGIMYVTAKEESIYERAEKRAAVTGRSVPKQLLKESIEEVPKSVDKLKDLVDVLHVISNEDGEPLGLESSFYSQPEGGWVVEDGFAVGGELKEEEKIGPTSVAEGTTFKSNVFFKKSSSWDEFQQSWKMDKTEVEAEAAISSGISTNIEQKQPENLFIRLAKYIKDKKKHKKCCTAPICNMANAMHCKIAKGALCASYQQSFPINLCHGCKMNDDVCGLCPHGNFICQCEICKASNMKNKDGGLQDLDENRSFQEKEEDEKKKRPGLKRGKSCSLYGQIG